jgi:hypothetical protein
MSDHQPTRLLGEAVVGLATDTFRLGRWLFGLSAKQRARRRSEEKALADERASLVRQREWLEETKAAMSRGRSGFANEAEANAALNGRGGRTSKLDERKFR